jgi:diguanylate cyclase (GGDEF)-like protein
MVRLFAPHAAISLVPVLLLGGALAYSYRSEAQDRGLSAGRAQATLVAKTAVEPLLLSGRPLSEGLTPEETADLKRLVARAIADRHLLRLRLRGLNGFVVFSDDGSGMNEVPEDEALDAAKGEVVSLLTRLNRDSNDVGPSGKDAVEVYMPLEAGSPLQTVGVLEVYVPYATIDREVTAGLNTLYRNLGVGLAVLYVALFVISASVSRRLRQQVALNAFLAEHDALTGLPNRTLFHRRAEEALRRVQTHPLAIGIVDLDRFKEVNDTLGHQNGDRMLVELAGRLEARANGKGTIARLGGDEFGVILVDVEDPRQAFSELRSVIEDEIEVAGLPLSVEASIGYVIAPDDGTEVNQLMQRADVAMYVAKSKQTGLARYDAADDHYDAAKLSLVTELRLAIPDGQLVLHYQPTVSMTDGSIEGVEALVRWRHPSLGLLPPAAFLPLAEQTDLIEALTTWVLTTALTEAKQRGLISSGLSIAVNVSARSVGRPEFAASVIDVIQQVDVPANQVIIEITETALLFEPERAAAALATLAKFGVRISLDDFGQGQTSLGYLSALPVHELKVDRGFVTDMLRNPAHGAIVRSIVDLGHNLGLRVVGEGIETEDALEALRAAGCDVAQGFLLARPMPGAALEDWLADHLRTSERSERFSHRSHPTFAG